ncbi:two-component system CheB/CheR fusion protein [Crossiella equi]|uniref:protein-glutamate O-methyltransferase n=1 Tax=Crossiella equi TaxID=130796 RepID=A0ABS5A8V3_9PSEU|nr:CheR family methyltransferase [Crossiella equi]MBP2473002.1 two-component system CheB/CheR fusion protein [Crossiella equi]
MTQTDPQFEALLVYLKETRGFDFTGYKRSSLMRRVNRRMSQLGIGDYVEYLDQLQVHSDEFTTLFNTILINVTNFFRDNDAWDYLREEVLPGLVEAKDEDSPIRLWSAGCASGEEAYTLAMVLAEMLGMDEFRRRVKIYATDVDEEGLSQARHASYSDRDVRNVPPELLDRYFEQANNRYVFRKDLRRSVIFGRNDLVQDAPISRIDLLICRNTLMYFNAETQSRILSRLYFALAEGGVLFLGKAEMLLSHSSLFVPIDLKRRVFRKVPRQSPPNGTFFTELPQPLPRNELVGLDLLRNEAFSASPVAQIVVTADGLVALTNRQAEALFGISAKDMGRPFRDLDVSYRPVELRRYIEQAQVDRRTVRVPDVEFNRAPGELLHLEIAVNPLVDNDSSLLGVTLVFHDVTSARRLQDELEHSNRQLETAYEELQSTNEELETTNEELQSTVEELETTNEELQSTNEELETMNEELQSTNDELQTINDELRDRSSELDDANAFLEAILTSLRAGVAVLNRDLQVQVWNRRAEDLWGLRQEEAVGQHFLNLDIGLPTDQVRPGIKQVLNGDGQPHELSLEAVNRRGRTIDIRVVCSALNAPGTDVTGVILLMEQDDAGTA